MDFKEQKKVLKAQMKRGDRTTIAELAGNVTLQTVRNAFSRESLQQMTPGELLVWETAVQFIGDRQKKLERSECKTAKILSKSCQHSVHAKAK